MGKDKLYHKSPKVRYFRYRLKKRNVAEMSTRERKRLNKNNIKKQPVKSMTTTENKWLAELAFIIVAIIVCIAIKGA